MSGSRPTASATTPYRRARGLDVAEERGIDVAEPARRRASSRRLLDGASLVLAAGPAGVEVLPASRSGASSTRSRCSPTSTPPSRSGIEGTEADDDLDDHDGKRVLGALAIGGPKMKVHKACVRRLFESNDAILDVDGVYDDRQGARSERARASPGVDPGTVSFEVCALDGGRPLLEASFPSAELGADPAPLVDALLAPRARSISCSARPATACRSSRPRRSASASSR